MKTTFEQNWHTARIIRTRNLRGGYQITTFEREDNKQRYYDVSKDERSIAIYSRLNEAMFLVIKLQQREGLKPSYSIYDLHPY